MSGEVEAVGEIATGALMARAAEPPAGEGDDGHTHETACLNCGTRLIGSHCHACGQHAHVHRTIGAFFHDFLHGVFHFEGKIWRTIPLLAWRPGRITREYIDGRRASFVSPIALFLFAVFLMFAAVKGLGADLGKLADINVNGTRIQGVEANRAEIARLEKERAALVAAGKPTDAIDGEIEGRKSAIEEIEAVRDPAKKLAEELGEEGGKEFQTSSPAVAAIARKVRENPALALYELQSNAYKFAWALIPLSVPFVWLLFPFSRRFGLYDHTVFVTYSLSFMMLLVALVSLMTRFGIPGGATLMVLVPPLHIYKQVRHAYGLTRLSAMWRTVALLAYAFCALVAFMVLIVALG